MASQIDKVVNTYRLLAQIPALIGAKLVENGNIVQSVWSQRNLDKGKSTKFLRSHVLAPDLKLQVDHPIPIDISSQLLTCVSPSKQICGILRDVDSKQFLEIWSNQNLMRSVDLKALDIHGDVYTDGEFASFEFSPDETKLLYIAEKKPVKTESFIKRSQNKNENKDNGDVVKGEEHLFKQDWGEQLVGKIQSVIVLYDIISDTVQVVSGVPEDVCPAQPTWSPDGTYIAGIAFKVQPRKLGLIYCSNRLSTIFKIDFEGNYTAIKLNNKSVQSPRFTLDGKSLIWLQRTAGGPHASTLALVKINLPLTELGQVDTVLDIIQTEIKTSNDKPFYGLYNNNLLNKCWASERRLILSTNQRNSINTYVVNIDSGVITELEYALGSQIVLDVEADVVLVNRRNFFKQDVLAVGKLPEVGQETAIEWQEITQSETVLSLQKYTFNYLELVQNTDDDIKKFSAIYIGPKSGSEGTVPLIVWPHGGPHSAFANNLSLEASLFASLGFAVLLINYRGSIGAGQASVNFLLGRIGVSDVSDCVLATKKVLEQYPWLNPNSIALVGGSHGGFLVSHLSGQFPEMYKVVVARNPVIDIASMSIISDIPDWCFVEVGNEYTQIGEPDNELLLFMRKHSPIQHAHKVQAPTLLQIGSQDLRVPPHQATDYYHRLKANGITVKMNLYEDNHPLGSITNEADNLINSVLWILEHLKIQL